MKTTIKENTLFFSSDYNLDFISLEESISDISILDLIQKTINQIEVEIGFHLIVTATMGVKFINGKFQTIVSIHGSSIDSTISAKKWKEGVIYFSKIFYKNLKKDSEELSSSFSQKYIKIHFRSSKSVRIESD